MEINQLKKSCKTRGEEIFTLDDLVEPYDLKKNGYTFEKVVSQLIIYRKNDDAIVLYQPPFFQRDNLFIVYIKYKYKD